MSSSLRRGLPRTPGGEPWPPAGAAAPALDTAAAAAPPDAAETVAVALRRGLPRVAGGDPWPPAGEVQVPAPLAPAAAAPAPAAATETATEAVALRRGLPRVAGGPAWPNAETAQVPVREYNVPVEPAAAEPAAAEPAAVHKPAASKPAASKPAASRPAPAAPAAASTKQRAWLPWLIGLAVLGVVAVLGARWVVGTEWGGGFVDKHPGTQPLPENAPVGLPAWLGWSHFFNMFLMVLIVRTGLQVRTERKPEGYWAPRWAPKKKVSLTVWLHQALDVLWVLNGLIYYILLFATGHWVRIVPTSWEVFPNAVSAGLQYLTLDWPLENSWVHYNALQELAYFTTVFIAAPLAIISGIRISSLWSDNWTRAGKIYGAPLARKIHFSVMIYFLVFIAIHLFLVLFTGFRRNMAGMFAARGDVDPSVYATDWTGVWVFLGALVVIAAGWFLARPRFVAPLARTTGKVSNR